MLLQMGLAQNAETLLGSLPNSINESSGIDTDSQGRIWTHNDGGNPNKIYQISNTGQLLRTLTVLNATNVDWEDLTIDNNDILYLGDIGNNNNDRENLCIYIIDLKLIPDNAMTCNAQILFFRYADQNAFPPPNNQKHFDAEAIAWYNDSLFLFTKNRTSPNNGFTRCYKLPAQSGNFSAHYCNQYFTTNAEIDGRITGADIDWANKKLVLTSMTKIWKFNFSSSPYIFQNPEISTFQSISQKEGICFNDSCNLYITDELIDNLNVGGKLYGLKLCTTNTISTNNESSKIYLIFKEQEIYVHLPVFYYNKNLTLEFYDLNGKKMGEQNLLVDQLENKIDLNMDNSLFMLLIRCDNKIIYNRKTLRYAQ